MKYLLLLTTLLYWGACSNQTEHTTSQNTLEIAADSIYDSYTSADSSKNFLIDLHFLKFKCNNPAVSDSLNRFVMMQLTDNGIPTKTGTSEFYKTYAKAFKQEFMELIMDTTMSWAGYENTLNIAVAYQSEKRIGLVSDGYLFTAGAHGISSTYLANIRLKDGKKLCIAECFQQPENIRKKAEKIFRKNIGIAMNASLNEAGYWFENDVFKLTDNFLLTDSTVEFFYNVYEIAPYSNGPTNISVPINLNDLKE